MQSNNSFTFPPARPRSAPAGPRRVNNPRSVPYSRPSNSFFNNNNNSTTTTAEGGKWQHDLFGESSDLYQPKINVEHLSRVIPSSRPASASLRPFGDQTPAPQRLIHTNSTPIVPTLNATQQQEQEQQGGGQQDLAMRMGIKGSSQSEQVRQRELKHERLKLEQRRREVLRVRKLLEKERERQVEVHEQEETGFVVQVQGLVSGTSAEDVQTAFGSYGEITFCFVVNEKTARANEHLIARLTFSRSKDAKLACEKLNGAIADGVPLVVTEVPRTPCPPKLKPIEEELAALENTAGAGGGGGGTVGSKVGGKLGGNVPKGPRGKKMGVAAAQPPPPSIPSKMYADQVEASFTTIDTPSTSNSMDIDMTDDTASTTIPTGPRGGGGGRRGVRGGGSSAMTGIRNGVANNGMPHLAPPTAPRNVSTPAVQPQTSLLDRLGGGPGQVQGQGKGGKGKNKVVATPSLAERLGTTPKTTTQQNGGSLLSRLK